MQLRRPTRPATACARRARHGHRQVQQLHDGGRAADRLGLLRPGPRRPDPKTKNTASTCGALQLLRLVHRLPPGGHQPGRLRRPDGTPKMATLGDERQKNDALVQRRPGLGLLVRVRGQRPTACTSTSSTSAPTRRASCTTRSASGRSTAPARRRAAWRSARRSSAAPRATATCTFTSRTRARRRRPIPAVHPQDATAFLNSDVYRLSASATGTGWSAVPQERARRRQVRRDGQGPGLHREGANAAARARSR